MKKRALRSAAAAAADSEAEAISELPTFLQQRVSPISNAAMKAECCCCVLPESTSIPFQHLHTIPACSPIPVCSISARAPTPCCTHHNLYIRATCIHLALGPFKENAGISLKDLPLYSL